MENQRPDDPAKSVTPGGRQAVPCVCIADAEHSMRTFLAETLEDLGFTSCACTQATGLGAVLDSRRPDLVVIGSSPGGIEACEMLELLAAREFDGKVLVLGQRVSPMIAAIQELGAKLGLAMLPLLPTPFGDADVRGCVAMLMPVAPPPEAPGDTAEALRTDRLELWYQPKIDARTLALGGVEALVRVRHPTRGAVGQERVIWDDGEPALGALTDLAIARTIDDWRDFRVQHGHVEIGINLPIAFFRNAQAVGALCRQMPDHPAFQGLIVEINATEVVRNLELAKDVARRLRFHNIAISIDDLGAEWPSFLGLRDFPFVELRVDRQFVAGCGHDRSKQTTCRRIIELADAMGARTVAKGVETRTDFLAARKLGFHHVQGPLFARPMTAQRFARTVLGRPWTVPK